MALPVRAPRGAAVRAGKGGGPGRGASSGLLVKARRGRQGDLLLRGTRSGFARGVGPCFGAVNSCKTSGILAVKRKEPREISLSRFKIGPRGRLPACNASLSPVLPHVGVLPVLPWGD